MIRYILFILALLMLPPEPAAAYKTREEVLGQFTEQSPLLVVINNNFAPYEYINEHGRPAGYNIDLVNAIMHRLDVPVQFKGCTWEELSRLLESRQVHLALQPDFGLFSNHIRYGHSYLAPSHLAVAHNDKSTPSVTCMADLPEQYPIYYIASSISYTRAIEAGIDSSRMCATESRHILDMLENGEEGYFLSGRLTMKHIIHEHKYKHIAIDTVDLPRNTLRFCTYDRDLINILDEEFSRLEQRGDIQKLQNKWFYPEREHLDLSTLQYTLVALATIVSIIVLLVTIMKWREMRRHERDSQQAHKMMQAAIYVDGRDIVRFNFITGLIKNENGHFLPERGLMPEQYLQHVHPDDRPIVHNHMQQMARRGESADMFTSPSYRWRKRIDNYKDENLDSEERLEREEWRTIILQSIFEYDKNGRPISVTSTINDITDEMTRTRQEEEDMEMFYRIFDNAILGMGIYSPDGTLIEGNHRMHEIFHLDNTNDISKHGYYISNCLYDMPALSGILNRDNPQELWMCTTIHPGHWLNTTYIELHITPVRDNQQQLVFLLVSVRDISDDVQTYHLQKSEQKQVQQNENTLRQSEEELSILLQEAHMRIWTIDDEAQTISFFSHAEKAECVLTFQQFIEYAERHDDKRKAQQLVNRDQEFLDSPNTVIAMKQLLNIYDTTQYYTFSYLGIRPAPDGSGLRPYGLALNTTGSVLAEQELEAEKRRATESEHQKSIFLNSMAHEIRTPLNSIVGFSEVLPMLEGEERNMIAGTIQENCDKLMRLTDDILTISAMDVGELTFDYHIIDFSDAFDREFEHLRIYIDPNSSVQFKKDNPCKHLQIRTDMRRISQILTNFLTNAVKYTRKGHIQLGYYVEGDRLRIYCQDTGSGISQEHQADIFNRFFQTDLFVQGTGMGLSVCKSIAEAMGGVIGLDSKEGEGSTFYVTLPIAV